MTRITVWKWSTEAKYKAEAIDIDSTETIAERAFSSRGSKYRNPSVFATLPLSSSHSTFRIVIHTLGKFIGIGVADVRFFIIEGDRTLGTQTRGFNSSYYWQNNGLRKIQAYGEPIQVVENLNENDIVDINVDFAQQHLHYWKNGNYVGTIQCIKFSMTEGFLYPCINLSSGTKAEIMAVPQIAVTQEVMETVEEAKRKLTVQLKALQLVGWRWGISSDKRPSVIEVSEDCRLASRTGKSHNPSILAETPLTRMYPKFRVQILKLGNFVGIGVAELGKFVLESNKTLGQQQIQGINSSYFWQNNGINKIQLYGEGPKLAVPISVGSIVDVKIDFDNQRIYYWHNEKIQGYITSTRNKIIEGNVYPAANLSIGSEVLLRDDSPELDTEISDEAIEEDDISTMPDVSWPTNWTWSAQPHKRALAISIDDTGTHAVRIAASHNPGIMTTYPFTEICYYFQLKIKTLGKFIGVGLADRNYLVSGGTTLGSQINGVNASYFWQNNGVQRLQMYGEEKIRVRPLAAGDTVAIAINFKSQAVFFFRNHYLEGTILSKNNELIPGKIFPCVNLSDGTEVVIENVQQDPTIQGDPK